MKSLADVHSLNCELNRFERYIRFFARSPVSPSDISMKQTEQLIDGQRYSEMSMSGMAFFRRKIQFICKDCLVSWFLSPRLKRREISSLFCVEFSSQESLYTWEMTWRRASLSKRTNEKMAQKTYSCLLEDSFSTHAHRSHGEGNVFCTFFCVFLNGIVCCVDCGRRCIKRFISPALAKHIESIAHTVTVRHSHSITQYTSTSTSTW